MPPLLTGLVDNAAVLPPCTATLPAALSGQAAYLGSWYAGLVGPLLIPASRHQEVLKLVNARVEQAEALADDPVAGGPMDGGPMDSGPMADGPVVDGPVVGGPGQPPLIGIVGDGGPAPAGLREIAAAITTVRDWIEVAHVEVPVAMRGDDPAPGLRAVLDLGRDVEGVVFFAEIPLTWGLLASLDRLAEARAEGSRVAPKFRTGGLAAELFPTPMELAAVICACRDRDLPFKLTAGLHRAIRRTDPETGLVNHGFLNVLAAVLAAADGAEAVDLAEILGTTDPLILVESVRGRLVVDRPLWRGFGSCSLVEPLADLRSLGFLPAPAVPRP